MSPDDPRHGTVAGYVAHVRSGSVDCDPCRRAKMRYEKERLLSGPKTVPSIGTRRRIRALRALGYSLAELAEAGGWKTEHAAFKYAMTSPTITATTAARVAGIYEILCMRPATGPRANRLRIIARRNGWAPPLAWDDIDNDPDDTFLNESRGVEQDSFDIDEVVVLRALEGDLHEKATNAERAEIARRWASSGRSLNDLARLTGWKIERYYKAAA